jgi:hypothetical protein
MALPPGIGSDLPDGDRKRLMQRADSFAIGTGTRELKDRDDVKEFDEALEDVGAARLVKGAEEDLGKQAKETEDYRKEQLQEEAEKRGSSSPPPNLYPGCLTLPGLGVPMLVLGETGRSESQRRSAGVESGAEKMVPVVSAQLLRELRDAGLSDPVESLDDPRLAKSPEGLKESFTMSLRGHDRVYVWNGAGCHQILTIGLNETRVESAAGGTVETLRRQGTSDDKTVASRAVPEGRFPDLSDPRA